MLFFRKRVSTPHPPLVAACSPSKNSLSVRQQPGVSATQAVDATSAEEQHGQAFPETPVKASTSCSSGVVDVAAAAVVVGDAAKFAADESSESAAESPSAAAETCFI